MSFKFRSLKLTSLLLMFMLGLSAHCNTPGKKHFVAIEFNKVVCGYSEITIIDSIINGNNITVLSQEVHFDFSALGRDLSQYQKFTYHIDPVSGNFVYHDSYHKQPDMERGGSAYVENGVVRFGSSLGDEEEICELPDNTILPNTLIFHHLKRDFAGKPLEEKTYQIYDVRIGKISKISYKKTGEELLSLAGKQFMAMKFDEADPITGLTTKYWIDEDTGIRLRMESPTQLIMYLADSTITSKIKKGNWDDVIFGKTNKNIPKVQAISYMKVKVILDTNTKPTFEGLNIEGQSFTGEVDDKRINGVFEIKYRPYNGKNAPPFPMDWEKYEGINEWLEPSLGIESDDEVLIKAAKEITEGSKDLWEAAHRISEWVIKNIDGSLLSGSARETYDSKTGLCAAQSMLTAALCRAVGIPARVALGCMYTHYDGGSFGSHGWNEVFMGKAGWIPIDVTSNEDNYVDSGHIRLGVLKTSHTIIDYQLMDILDFKTSKRF